MIGIFILNKSCKEDNENSKYQIKNALKSKPKLSSVYSCDGEGSMVCESSQTCCNYNANCCSTRINLVRSNYSSSYAYAQALACELEKVLNGCTPQQVEYGCSVDKFCWAFNSATFGNINDYFGGTNTNPFAFCTHDTNTSPYTCGGIQYNVDISISLQNTMASVIRTQFNDSNAPTCPSGYTRRLVKQISEFALILQLIVLNTHIVSICFFQPNILTLAVHSK